MYKDQSHLVVVLSGLIWLVMEQLCCLGTAFTFFYPLFPVLIFQQCVDGRLILKWIFKGKGCENVDWIYLDQDREQWHGLVNTVMNFMFCKR
jgi:hypothetical protein